VFAASFYLTFVVVVVVAAFETTPSIVEAIAYLQLLERPRNTPEHKCAWITFSCRDDTHLSDGTPVEDAIRMVAESNRVCGVGFNCVNFDFVTELLRRARDALLSVPKPHPEIVVYPNSGDGWDAEAKEWIPRDESGGGRSVQDGDWISTGASLIGGCCQTTPELIRLLKRQRES
jgi:homocysteine S-methyltransferase